MLDLRPVWAVAGALLAILALAMLVPAAVDLATGHSDWRAFLAASAITFFVGGALLLASRQPGRLTFTLRQTFLVANLAWAAAALFGALPFIFATARLDLTDAFFEAMSGITGTGATVLNALRELSPGVLLWRGLLNWLGGFGMIVTALAVLPALRIGGMQLFRIEAFAPHQSRPHATRLGLEIALCYTGLTLAGIVGLWLCGMRPIDAATHAMAAISTGGFTNGASSVIGQRGIAIELLLMLLMILGALPFLLLARACRGSPVALLRDVQVRWLLGIVAATGLLLAAWLDLRGFYDSGSALRHGFFTAISMVTGTGFLTADPSLWGGFPIALLLIVMFAGGAAGSTAGGVKIFRIRIFVSVAFAQLRRLTRPHGVFIPSFNNRPVPDEITDSVMGFFFLFGLAYIVLTIGLGLMGLDLTTALSTAASAIANVGPGLGDRLVAIGNFTTLPDVAKWWLAFGMLVGRLELITLLVLLSRGFWRP